MCSENNKNASRHVKQEGLIARSPGRPIEILNWLTKNKHPWNLCDQLGNRGQAPLGTGDRFRLQNTHDCSHLSQLEHRKTRKVMRRNMTTAARLPQRTTCICMWPPLRALPSGPMVGAGMASCQGQVFTSAHMGLESFVFLQRGEHIWSYFPGDGEHS